MSGNSFDEQGEAHEALGTAVSSYGSRVLGDPRILGNLVTDLLPDLPRERNLLVTAAEAGVAAELVQHVEQQHLDVDTAIQLVARSLTERRSLDAAASTWVTTEYAQALGYPVRAQAGPGRPSAQDSAGAPPTVTIQAMSPLSPPVAPMPVPPPVRPAPAAPAQPAQAMRAPAPQPQFQPQFQPQVQPPQPQPPQGQPPQGQPPRVQPPQGQPPQGQPGLVPPMPFPQTPYGGQPPGGRSGGGSAGPKRGLLAGGGVAAVVVLYLIVAAVAHTPPFSKATPKPSPSPVVTTPKPPTPTATTPTPTPTPTPTTTQSLAAGVVPIATLLPSDLDDVSMECAAQHESFPWAMPGLVTALKCTDPGLPGGQVFAFQMDNSADYLTTWQNFNKWWGFNLSTAGTACPPSAGDTQGTTEWRDKTYPYRNGQVLECETVGSGSTTQASYTWTFPTEDGFIIAQAAHSWTFSQLNTWWLNT